MALTWNEVFSSIHLLSNSSQLTYNLIFIIIDSVIWYFFFVDNSETFIDLQEQYPQPALA